MNWVLIFLLILTLISTLSIVFFTILCGISPMPTSPRVEKVILALLKKYKSKTVIEKNGVEREVIDPQSIPLLLADDPDKRKMWSQNKSLGFLFGCIKQLVERVEELEGINKKNSFS